MDYKQNKNMKTIAYFFWTGEVNQMFLNSIESYKKLNWFDEWYILTDNDSILSHHPDFKIIYVPADWTDKRFYLKMSELRKIQANEGDRIMVLDGDTLCMKPLDNFFIERTDIVLTTRHKNDEFRINAGVWGFIKNEVTDAFLNHAAATITNPSNWLPYYHLKVNHPWTRARSLTNIDWPVDQDYLEIVYTHRNDLLSHINIDAKVSVHENGTYNFIVGSADHPLVKEFDPYIVHFKNMSSVKWKEENNMKYN
jgi:hypothetical protein